MKNKRTIRGFTLVELLVVIGIIALLISILLPSLSKAQRAAKNAACLANMRSLGQAVAIYQSENRQSFPPLSQYANGSFSSNNFRGFNIWGLLRIKPGNMVAVCPQVFQDMPTPSQIGSPRSFFSYKYNWYLAGAESNTTLQPWLPHPRLDASTGLLYPAPAKAVSHSSEVLMFMDFPQIVAFQTDDSAGSDRGIQYVQVSLWNSAANTSLNTVTATGEKHQIARQVAPVHGAIRRTPNGVVASDNQTPADPALAGSINVAYCDGSVRSVDVSQGLVNNTADPTKRNINTDATNGGYSRWGMYTPIPGTRLDWTMSP